MRATPLTAKLPAALQRAGFLPEVVTLNETTASASAYGAGAKAGSLTPIPGLTGIAAAIGYPSAGVTAEMEKATPEGSPVTERRLALISYSEAAHTGLVLTWGGAAYDVVDVRSDQRLGFTELRMQKVTP